VKNDAAKVLSKRIKETEGFEDEIPALVAHWFNARGCRVRYDPMLAQIFAPIGDRRSDSERRLIWLSTQIAPTLRELQEWYSRRQLIALLFDGADPGTLEVVRSEADPQLAAYDARTRAEADETGRNAARQPAME